VRPQRRRLVQAGLLVVGLAGITVVVFESVNEAQEQVLPSAASLVAASLLVVISVVCTARAWSALFSDLLGSRARRLALHSTFYLAQLTKYLPAGGVVQTTSQLGLARGAGVPLRRSTVALPVSVVCVVVAGAAVGSGLVAATDLPGWVRLLAFAGLGTVVLLHRGIMAAVLGAARRVIKRIPDASHLPSQRDILIDFLWALAAMITLCAAYAAMLVSLTDEQSPFVVFSAFAVSWVAGFLAVPIPAGVGVREVVLLALLPGVGAGPVFAASLALRLMGIGAELLALLSNKIALRRAPSDPDRELDGDAPRLA
jgi:uncharacterized membrane protein YbhN (UPF0104 family)